MNCVYCGGETYTMIFVKDDGDPKGGYKPVCTDCAKRIRSEKIEAELKNVHRASDFSSWKKEDMSEAFWMHLIRFQKCPNKHSLSVMKTAFHWACHADHGLSNSFSNALNWCGIDLFEQSIKDLPFTDEVQN